MPEQVPLPLKLDRYATFESFYPASNKELVEVLKQFSRQKEGCWIYCFGGESVGVSHLLQAVCLEAENEKFSVICLDCAEIVAQEPSLVLEAIEGMDVICMDNFDALALDRRWQEPLFYFINKLKLNLNSRLLIGSKKAISQLTFDLNDLLSRLQSAIVFNLKSLDDEEKKALLMFRANRLGLDMTSEVATYIYNRSSRNLNDLMTLLDRLDKQALISQRRLSIPWIKSILDW